MSKTPHTKPRSGGGKRGQYMLRLFIAGGGTNSKLALINLRRLCREHLKGRSTIETVDVTKDFEAAARDNILVTPALVLIAPHPRVVILGNLSDLPKVLAALRVSAS